MFVQGRRERTPVQVGLAVARGAELPEGLADALATHPPPPTVGRGAPQLDERQRAKLAGIDRVHVGPLKAPMDEAAARDWAQEKPAVQEKDGRERAAELPDAVVWLPAPAPADDGAEREDEPSLTVFYSSTETASELARRRVAERLPPYVERLRAERLPGGTPASALVPFALREPHDIAPAKDAGAKVLSVVLPMLLVVMCVLGAFFPAVDVTAGERERNTAETTLLLPVPRLAVQQGKILAVCASALVATALNLLALALSAGHLLHMLASGQDIQVELPLGAFVAIAPLALLFAFFVSAVLVGIASFARTFKEGQALLGPVQMLFILPAMACAIPGLELTPGLATVPVVNVVLAFREILNGEAHPLEFAITGVTLLASAVLAIAIAVRLLSREVLAAPERRRSAWRWLGLSGDGR
jgi:ABC-type Na+ efflux pump permease subunit